MFEYSSVHCLKPFGMVAKLWMRGGRGRNVVKVMVRSRRTLPESRRW
jgi:hypothetical protein